MISDADRERLLALAEADGQDFARLAKLAGLDPATSFRGADLRDVDFEGSDLSGFDFSDADLSGASFRRAKIAGLKFDRAIVADVRWPVRRQAVEPSEQVRLSRVQRMAVEAMLEDFADHRRALALMPTGSGRHVVLEEVIAAEFRHGTHRGLLITGSAAERDMMVDRLRRRLPDIPVGTLKEIRMQPVSEGLLVHNQVGIGGSLDNQLDGTAWGKSIEAVFATTTERLPQVLSAKMIGDNLRVAAVDTPLLDVGRPDRNRQLGRISKIFGKPSFTLSVEQFIEQGKLTPVRVVSPFPIEGELLPRRSYPFSRQDLRDEELQARLEPSVDALIETQKIIGFDAALVLCGDDRQARAAWQMLNQRWGGPRTRGVAGQRWSASHIAAVLKDEKGLLIAPVTRQAIDAATRASCVAVLTDLKLEYAQDIVLRPSETVERLRPLVLDFAGAFRGFSELEYGLDQFSA